MKSIFYFVVASIAMISPAYAETCQDLYVAHVAYNEADADYENHNYHGKINEIEIEYGYCVTDPTKDEHGKTECNQKREEGRWDLDREEARLLAIRNEALYRISSIEDYLRRMGIRC